MNPNEEPAEGTPAPTPIVAKMIRKRKLLTADSEIEISKKEYSQHLKDTSNIIKKVPFIRPSIRIQLLSLEWDKC